jgi:Flp pilus assembly pilin Flp
MKNHSIGRYLRIVKRTKLGATLLEYTLIGSMIATMLVVGYKTVGNSYVRIYNNIINAI